MAAEQWGPLVNHPSQHGNAGNEWPSGRSCCLSVWLSWERERGTEIFLSFSWGNVGRGRVSTLKTDSGHDFLKAEFFQRNGTEREKRRREKERASGGAAPAAPPAVQHSTESDITDVWLLVHLIDHLDVNSIKQSFNLNFNWIKGQFEWN